MNVVASQLFSSFQCQCFFIRQLINVGHTRLNLLAEHVVLFVIKCLHVDFHLFSA